MTHSRLGKIERQRKTVVIAINPRAGSVDTETAAQQLFDHLAVAGLDPMMESDLEKICQTAHQATKNGELRAVVAAGGDGTVSLLANRLSPEVPIAILPQGTENLLAKHLEVPFAPRQVCELIQTGCTATLDAGEANGKLFLVMASCGFDADVVRQLHEARRGHIRHWYYFRPIFNSIMRYRYPTISVQVDGSAPVKVKWAFVFNAPRYAMGLPIAEDADAMDGQLDLCAFRGGNFFNGLMYFFGVIARQHRRWKDTLIAQPKTVQLTSHEEVPYQLDGDPGGVLPVNINVLTARMKIIVPEPWWQKRAGLLPSEIAGDDPTGTSPGKRGSLAEAD